MYLKQLELYLRQGVIIADGNVDMAVERFEQRVGKGQIMLSRLLLEMDDLCALQIGN